MAARVALHVVSDCIQRCWLGNVTPVTAPHFSSSQVPAHIARSLGPCGQARVTHGLTLRCPSLSLRQGRHKMSAHRLSTHNVCRSTQCRHTMSGTTECQRKKCLHAKCRRTMSARAVCARTQCHYGFPAHGTCVSGTADTTSGPSGSLRSPGGPLCGCPPSFQRRHPKG